MDGWIQIHGWLPSRPAGFFKKKAAGRRRKPAAADSSLFFEKSGRPAGQPTMYLDPPIHFGGILLVLVYYGMYFPYYDWKTPNNDLKKK